MAFNWAAAFAIGKAAYGVGKAIKGHMGTKSAGSAGLVDPTQAAMVNLMHRRRRQIEVGTDYDRAMARKGQKTLTRRSILAGKRDLSQLGAIQSQTEAAIREGASTERLGLLKYLTDETRNMADRSMDLVELAGERQRTYGQAAKQTAAKNVASQLEPLQDMLQQGQEARLEKREQKQEAKALKKANKQKERASKKESKKSKNMKLGKDIVGQVGGAVKGVVGGGGGGGTGGGGGGFDMSSLGDAMTVGTSAAPQ